MWLFFFYEVVILWQQKIGNSSETLPVQSSPCRFLWSEWSRGKFTTNIARVLLFPRPGDPPKCALCAPSKRRSFKSPSSSTSIIVMQDWHVWLMSHVSKRWTNIAIHYRKKNGPMHSQKSRNGNEAANQPCSSRRWGVRSGIQKPCLHTRDTSRQLRDTSLGGDLKRMLVDTRYSSTALRANKISSWKSLLKVFKN